MNYIVYVTNNKKFGVKKEGGNRATKTFDKKMMLYNMPNNLLRKMVEKQLIKLLL